MNARIMSNVISHSVAAAFRTFYPNDARLLELADILENAAICLEILQSRVIEDKENKFKCAFR